MEFGMRAGEIIDATEAYRNYVLNTDKIENLDDCKKILKFLCGLTMNPAPDGAEYIGFPEVRKYFEQ